MNSAALLWEALAEAMDEGLITVDIPDPTRIGAHTCIEIDEVTDFLRSKYPQRFKRGDVPARPDHGNASGNGAQAVPARPKRG